jgi:hypothetical protein
MAGLSLNKGKAGEREAANLLALVTGFDVRRRVRQHQGDSDLEGVPGWSLEVKRHAAAPPAKVAEWWSQAVAQAQRTNTLPLLVFRADRGGWRCIWPADIHTDRLPAARGIDHTLSASAWVWWAMCQDTKEATSAA